MEGLDSKGKEGFSDKIVKLPEAQLQILDIFIQKRQNDFEKQQRKLGVRKYLRNKVKERVRLAAHSFSSHIFCFFR